LNEYISQRTSNRFAALSDQDSGIQRQQVVNSQMLAEHILVTQVRAHMAARVASQRQEARDAEVVTMVVDQQSRTVCLQWLRFCAASPEERVHLKCTHTRGTSKHYHPAKMVCRAWLTGRCSYTVCNSAHPPECEQLLVQRQVTAARPSSSTTASSTVSAPQAVHKVKAVPTAPVVKQQTCNAHMLHSGHSQQPKRRSHRGGDPSHHARGPVL